MALVEFGGKLRQRRLSSGVRPGKEPACRLELKYCHGNGSGLVSCPINSHHFSATHKACGGVRAPGEQMLFLSRQDQDLFAPNGIWGSTCYVLPDEKTKNRLKILGRVFLIATMLVFVLSAILNSWWVLVVGIIALVFTQTRCQKYVCRHCDTVEEKITIRNIVEELAASRKGHELWIAAISFPALAAYQSWKIFDGPDDMVWEALALFVFVALAAISIYAVILNEDR